MTGLTSKLFFATNRSLVACTCSHNLIDLAATFSSLSTYSGKCSVMSSTTAVDLWASLVSFREGQFSDEHVNS